MKGTRNYGVTQNFNRSLTRTYFYESSMFFCFKGIKCLEKYVRAFAQNFNVFY